MGCSARQLGRTAGVEIGEKESGGFAVGGGERKWQRGGFAVGTVAMRELPQGSCAVDVVREVQNRFVLRAGVPGRSFQRAQGDMPSYHFQEWFWDEINVFR